MTSLLTDVLTSLRGAEATVLSVLAVAAIVVLTIATCMAVIRVAQRWINHAADDDTDDWGTGPLGVTDPDELRQHWLDGDEAFEFDEDGYPIFAGD